MSREPEIRHVPMHRVRPGRPVLVSHHADGSRTICDENGIPDRYVPPSVTWAQFRPQRVRARWWGFAAGAAVGLLAGAAAALAFCNSLSP